MNYSYNYLFKTFPLFLVTITIFILPLHGQVYTLNFDGNEFVNIGNEVANGVRSIELWFKLAEPIDPSLSEYTPLVSRDDINNDEEFHITFMPIHVSNPGQLAFSYVPVLNTVYRCFSDTSNWQAGKWYHVAAVIDPVQGMKLYIDGQLQSSMNTNMTGPVPTSLDSTLLGQWGHTNTTAKNRTFKGQIDDVHFADEVLYQSNFTPPCTDRHLTLTTTGLYYANEGTGNILIDASNNHHDGQIVGANYSSDTICLNTAISEIRTLLKTTIYPNPNPGDFMVFRSPTMRASSIEVNSITGSFLMSEVVSNGGTITFRRNLPNGLYLITLISSDGEQLGVIPLSVAH